MHARIQDIVGILAPWPDLVERVQAAGSERSQVENVIGAVNELGRRSCYGPALEACDVLLADPMALGMNELARALHIKGILQHRSGDVLGAVATLHSARSQFELLKDAGRASRCWSALGICYATIHQWRSAEHALFTAIHLASEAGDQECELQARNNLIVARSFRGTWREVFADRVRTWRSTHGLVDPHGRVGVGKALRFLGRAGVAVDRLESMAREARDQHDDHMACLAHEYLADCYLDLKQPKKALKSLSKCLDIGVKAAPEGDLVCEAQRRIGEAHYILRNFDEAAEALAVSLRIAEKIHDDYERACVLRLQAAIEAEGGNAEKAEDLFAQAIHLCIQGGFRYEHAVTLEYRGHAHRRLGWADTAEAFFEEAQNLFRELRIHRLAIRLKEGRPAMARMPAPLKDPLANRAARWERFGILTRDEEFLRTLEMCERAAHTDGPVLIIGESGTGKELVARLIHKLSMRKGPLVDINCPAIPETMLESELFGSRRGAFTGAEDRAGLVAMAEGGTLFLDEIGDMPLQLQVKLLRFLESSEYRRVGETRTRTVSTRIVSATNADLLGGVDEKSFRRDLYHRLSGLILRIPPLRARGGDIDFLADHFLTDLYRGSGAVPSFDPAAHYAVRHYGWPGNVRELRHAITHALFALGDRKRITAEMLPDPIGSYSPRDIVHRMSGGELLEEIRRYKGNVSDLASSMGVSRQTIYRRLSELDIDPQTIRGGRTRDDDAAYDA